MMWTGLLATIFKLCRPNAEWAQVPHQCTANASLFITTTFEFTSGLILVILPATTFLLLKSHTTLLRVMIVLVAVIGLLLLGGSIAHAAFLIMDKDSSAEQLTTVIQVGSGLLLVNLPAFVLLGTGEQGANLDSPAYNAEPKLPPHLTISLPMPLGTKRSLARSPSHSQTGSSATEPSYHDAFFPPQSEEVRREKALMFGLHIDPSVQDSEDGLLRPPHRRDQHSSVATSGSMYSTDPIASRYMPGPGNVRFDSTPSIIPQSYAFSTQDETETPSTSISNSSLFSIYSLVNRPPPVADCPPRDSARLPTIVDAHEYSQQSSLRSNSPSGTDVDPVSPITPPRTPSLHLVPSDVKPTRYLTPSLAIEGYSDTPSESSVSALDSSTYSTLIQRYFVEEDPYRKASADSHDLLAPPATFIPGPRPLSRDSVAPMPF
ncbi:hypothetical protein V5O48_002116 [Marasmius crinis-equi]|uniref:Uncharacterized protein n=1 Tax=Marasmius crinis-equi TaxID=585013 RepID=A0ABR3FWN0_9AGAR